MSSPVADLLADLGRAFESIETPWYLFGARAAMLYGVARLTAGVDVTVRLAPQVSPERLAAALVQHRFQVRDADPGFLAVSRVLPIVHLPTRLPVDVVLGGPDLEDLFLRRAAVRVIDGVSVPVATAEDIVVMKVLAGRAKDVEDVVAIIAANGVALDVTAIRATLEDLEDALGQSDLIPVLDQSLARAARG